MRRINTQGLIAKMINGKTMWNVAIPYDPNYTMCIILLPV